MNAAISEPDRPDSLVRQPQIRLQSGKSRLSGASDRAFSLVVVETSRLNGVHGGVGPKMPSLFAFKLPFSSAKMAVPEEDAAALQLTGFLEDLFYAKNGVPGGLQRRNENREAIMDVVRGQPPQGILE